MNENFNVWGIREHEATGPSCPITPVHLPWHKKLWLFFFRFGVCPLCVIMSTRYNIARFFKKKFQRKP